MDNATGLLQILAPNYLITAAAAAGAPLLCDLGSVIYFSTYYYGSGRHITEGLILLLLGIGWDSLAGYTFARVSQNLGECRPSLSFQVCRTSIQITTVLHCLANYFLTIPASTGHSLCKPGAAAAAAAVYGVVTLTAKQIPLAVFSNRWRRQKELVQVPPLTRLKPNPYTPYSATKPVRYFGLGTMQTYNIAPAIF